MDGFTTPVGTIPCGMPRSATSKGKTTTVGAGEALATGMSMPGPGIAPTGMELSMPKICDNRRPKSTFNRGQSVEGVFLCVCNVLSLKFLTLNVNCSKLYTVIVNLSFNTATNKQCCNLSKCTCFNTEQQDIII